MIGINFINNNSNGNLDMIGNEIDILENYSMDIRGNLLSILANSMNYHISLNFNTIK